MVFRLVLGCGGVGGRVIEGLPALAAMDGELLVLTEDGDLVETLREDNVPARCLDPCDRTVLESLEEPDVVFVASDELGRNRKVAETITTVAPDATVIAYAPGPSTGGGDSETAASREADVTALERTATTVIDSTDLLARWILERSTTPAARRAITLRKKLCSIEGTLAVFAHDNPDPDAIASAIALAELAESVGVDAEACYYGDISHQENRAMVNLLDLDLRALDLDDPLEYEAFALVDHSRPGVNDQLPAELPIDIVIDHHPPRGPVAAGFYDLRERIGATSTMLTGYLDWFDLDISWTTATALLYGIRVDTNDFTREVSSEDFEAAATLWPSADLDILLRIEQPTVDPDVLDTVARAIKNRTRRDSVVVASAGEIPTRDALPQAADQLLAMEGIDTTLVFGFDDEMVFISARSRGSDIDLGEVLRDAYDQIGSAGGHANMAGAQLEIGVLGGTETAAELESILSVVEEVITDRFFEAIETRPGAAVGLYSQTSQVLFGTDES
ncbi:DHH family phosphoesterase [Halobacteria archaeon AArc-curdl1]|uniref:DHH family phosphoesterase n=1 Tax=Natronosalvus hydrolyticus TaxID=2979988 RepID=A0AAP2Z4D7_9EURY|nr:DHH family phosphoesterase [Halobacteria archaeon AArc-curdl1]